VDQLTRQSRGACATRDRRFRPRARTGLACRSCRPARAFAGVAQNFGSPDLACAGCVWGGGGAVCGFAGFARGFIGPAL